MNTHTPPTHPAAEELLVGWHCTVCGEWIPTDPTWSECPGRRPTPTGTLDRDGR